MDCTPGSALCSRSSYTITANGNSFILGCYTKAPEIISVNAYCKNTNNDVLSKGLRGFESQGKLPHVLPEKILNQAAVFLAVPESNSDSLSYENDFDSNDEIDVDMWEAMEILKGTDLHPNSHSQKVRVIGKTLR